MGLERRNQWLLVALIAGLGLAMYRLWPEPAANAPAATDTRRATRTTGGRPPVLAPDVHLESLERERPKPGDVERNLFEFKETPVLAPSQGSPVIRPDPPVASSGPPPPPGVVPIALKFIGILEMPAQSQRVAVLSDPRGVYHGREGDIIEGRYRILKIGTESIELAYVDGRGRQTIRLSGQ